MGFKLRSGNGVPFKQMGSSPAKDGLTLGESFGSYDFKTEDDIKQAKRIELSKPPESKTAISGLTTESHDRMSKEKPASERKKEMLPDESQPTVKTPKPIENKETKKKEGWLKRSLKKANKWRKSEQGKEFLKGLDQAGQAIARSADEGTSISTAYNKNLQQKKDNESRRLMDETRKIKLDDYKKSTQTELPETNKFATTKNTDGKLTANTGKVQPTINTKLKTPGYLGQEFARQDRLKKIKKI